MVRRPPLKNNVGIEHTQLELKLSPPTKRKMYKKAIRKVAAKKKSQAKKNKDTFYLNARVTAQVTPSQGVSVANYVYGLYDLMNPTKPIGVTQQAEFSLYKTLYDRVRINSVKITVTPKANFLAANTAQADGSYNLTGDGMIHTVIDNDGQAPSSKGRLVKYNSYKKYSLLKPWSRMYSVKYPTGIWLDCQNIYEDTTLLKRLGLTGGITVYAENVIEDIGETINEPLYDVLIEYGCVFQGRAEGTLTYNPDTKAITVSPSDEATYAVPTDPVPLSGTFQDKRYDASGNLVPIDDNSMP